MIDLTAENAADYLRASGRVGPGSIHAEALGGGVSNIVLRVSAANSTFVLKQSRPQLRTKDAWFSDLARIFREYEVMEALAPFLPELTVPRVLFVDRPNYLFAMSHAPAEAKVWKSMLLAGQVDEALGELVGQVLGLMHENSARHLELFARFADPTVFDQLRIDPFYRRVQERRSEVARPVADLIEQMLTRKEALCHGDYTPKNMLVHEAGFTLVDYETAYFGDPTMDLGLCLAHLLLKAVHRPEIVPDIARLTQAIWRGYGQVVRFEPLAELERRGIAHVGACLLARVDGTSPVDYLREVNQKDRVRRLGQFLLLDKPASWDDSLAYLASRQV